LEKETPGGFCPREASISFRDVKPSDPVPNDTTYDEPLVFFLAKNKKPKICIPLELLLEPSAIVHSPRPPGEPKFVYPDNWLDKVTHIAEQELAVADGEECGRVRPMAVARCSRGGKTRFLTELTTLTLVHDEDIVSFIFVSFNGFSVLDEYDQEEPLQALLLRIAFAAYREKDNRPKSVQLAEFRKKNYAIQESDILKWLGQKPAILLVDELNSLRENSPKATEVAMFIKTNFLAPPGRFFVFSTNILSTLEAFGEFLDPTNASERSVLLQELPLLHSLTEAKILHPNLEGAREAAYYGLMPGLLHVVAPMPTPAIKRSRALTKLKRPLLIRGMPGSFSILESFLDGNVKQVPALLHPLLDALTLNGAMMIRWVPYHF
jgi:hypothetical protein